MPTFKPGDVVELKSGSLPMTVSEYKWDPMKNTYHEDQLVCTWSDEENKIQSMVFSEAVLRLSEPDVD